MSVKNMSVISVGQIYPYRGAIYVVSGTAHAPLSLDWAQIAAFTLSVIGPDLSQKFDIIICLLYFQTTAMYSRKQKMYNGLGTMPSPTPELS